MPDPIRHVYDCLHLDGTVLRVLAWDDDHAAVIAARKWRIDPEDVIAKYRWTVAGQNNRRQPVQRKRLALAGARA